MPALTPDGRLSTAVKKAILLGTIYGVDLDAQAVEVTKLSLLLTLSFSAWVNSLLQEHPDLWVEGELVYLDDEDLTRLVQRLAAPPELPQLSPPIYPDEACYLARRVRELHRRALAVLAELEANPAAYGVSLRGLVCDLADGDGTADRVFCLTHRQVAPRPGSPDPAEARQALLARLEALRYYPRPSFQG